MRRIGAGMALALACMASSNAGRSVTAQARTDLGPAVQAALDAARQMEPDVIADQVAICEIPAPPFKESARAAEMQARFEAAGLKNVRTDKAGNVIGDRPGRARRPHLVIAAHLDTVFPEGTNVSTTRAGTTIRGPGIGDNCRGLAVLIGTARALDRGGVVTEGPISFVANVGEEGLGDLRGARELFEVTMAGGIDRFVSIDSAGPGITNVAVGSHRYRVTFRGPGGHSFGAFGLVNPIHALGRAVGRIADFQVPANPRVTFNVGRIGGGTSINSIPYEAWFEMDMRSSDAAELARLDSQFQEAVDRAVAEENARWRSGTITVAKELVGDRPAGRTPADSVIVVRAIAATKAVGLPVSLGEGSTDSNVPISLKIPAITVGGGGRGSGGHSLAEAFDPADSWKGTQRAVLLAVMLSQQ